MRNEEQSCLFQSYGQLCDTIRIKIVNDLRELIIVYLNTLFFFLVLEPFILCLSIELHINMRRQRYQLDSLLIHILMYKRLLHFVHSKCKKMYSFE